MKTEDFSVHVPFYCTQIWLVWISLPLCVGFFFSQLYQTLWGDALVTLTLAWHSRLHRNPRHVRFPYSYYWTLWFQCDLFWKMGSRRKHENISEGSQTLHFLVSNCFLAANVFSVIDICKETRLNVPQTLLQQQRTTNCTQFHVCLKWMSRRYFLNEHKYPCALPVFFLCWGDIHNVLFLTDS